MSDQVFYILLSLVEGPAHGYAILQSVEARTDGALKLGSGTLYSAIKRMRSAGWIERVAGPGEEDPRRKYYSITSDGRRELAAEARRHALLAEHASALLAGKG